MKVAYIKKMDNKKSMVKYVKLIELVEEDDAIIISLKKIKKKTYKKLKEKLKKYNISKIIISKELKQNSEFVTFMEEKYGKKVVKSRDILIFSIYEILRYILAVSGRGFHEIELYILVKEFSKTNMDIINMFVEQVKILNIVTRDIKRYQNYEKRIFENSGIIISVNNNKKKSLARAKFILNIDLNKEELQQYSINREAIIINIKNEIKMDSKSFNGVNINSIKIKSEQQEEFYKDYDELELYQVKGDFFEITGLIGENGIIKEQDFARIL